MPPDAPPRAPKKPKVGALPRKPPRRKGARVSIAHDFGDDGWWLCNGAVTDVMRGFIEVEFDDFDESYGMDAPHTSWFDLDKNFLYYGEGRAGGWNLPKDESEDVGDDDDDDDDADDGDGDGEDDGPNFRDIFTEDDGPDVDEIAELFLRGKLLPDGDGAAAVQAYGYEFAERLTSRRSGSRNLLYYVDEFAGLLVMSDFTSHHAILRVLPDQPLGDNLYAAASAALDAAETAEVEFRDGLENSRATLEELRAGTLVNKLRAAGAPKPK